LFNPNMAVILAGRTICALYISRIINKGEITPVPSCDLFMFLCLFLCCFISVLYRHSLTSHLMIKLFTSMLRLKIFPLFEHIMHVSSLSESTLCIVLCISGISPPRGTGAVPSSLCHALPPSYKGVCLSPSCEPPAHGLHVQAKEQ
jgi:hypothetical protein